MTYLEQIKRLIAERDTDHAKYEDENGDVPLSQMDDHDKVTAGFEYDIAQIIDGLVHEIENPKLFTVVVESAPDDFPTDLLIITVPAASEDEAEQAAIRAAEQSFMDNSGRNAAELAVMKAQKSVHFDVQGLFVGRNLRTPNNSTVIDLTEKEN